MLLIVGAVLLAVWLVSLSGILPGGELAHVLLLAGLMCVLLSFARARDAALKRNRPPARPHNER